MGCAISSCPHSCPNYCTWPTEQVPYQKFTQSFSCQPFLPQWPTHEEDGKIHGEAPGLEMCCPFPVIQPPTVLSKHSLPWCHSCGVPSNCSFALHPESQQHLCLIETTGNAAACWKSHLFTCGLCSSITAKAITSPGNELGQLSTTLLLQLC